MEDALDAYPAVRALGRPIEAGHECSEPETQSGLIIQPGLTPQPRKAQTTPGQYSVPDMAHLEIPSWMGAAVGGDEQRKGPIYNYARILTWYELATSVNAALRATTHSIGENRACPPNAATDYPKWDKNGNANNLVGPSDGVAKYCGLDSIQLKAYPAWSSVPPEVYRRIVAASLVALFLQWGTTGSSIMIAYVCAVDTWIAQERMQ